MKDRELRDLERESGLDPEDVARRRRLRRSLARSDQEFDEGFLARVREALASSSWTVTKARAIVDPELGDDPAAWGRLLQRLVLDGEHEAGDRVAARAVWALSPPGRSDLGAVLAVFTLGEAAARAAARARLRSEEALPSSLAPDIGEALTRGDAGAIEFAVRLGDEAEPLLTQIRDSALRPDHLPELARLGKLLPRLERLLPELRSYAEDRLVAAIENCSGARRALKEFRFALKIVDDLDACDILLRAFRAHPREPAMDLEPHRAIARRLDQKAHSQFRRRTMLEGLAPTLSGEPSPAWIHAAFLADWLHDRPRWDRGDALLDRLKVALSSTDSSVRRAACRAISLNLQSPEDRLLELRPELEVLARDGVPDPAPGRQTEPKVGRGGATDRPERPRDRLDDRLAEPLREPGAPVPTSLCEVYREDDDEVREAARQALAAMDDL